VSETLCGTVPLVRLGLRRDRVLLPLWILGFALMAFAAASAGTGLFPDVASRIEASDTINNTASLVALFGRVYDPASLGALSLIKYTAFMAAVLAVVMVFVMIRHTRAEEEGGRLELLGGGRLGRNAPLAAALLIGFGASLVLGLLSAAALIAGGLPAGGSLAFGLGWATTGMAFCAVAGVAAQLTTGSRSAIGIGVVVVAVTYTLRAVGDLAEPSPSAWSWLSPIGWNQQVRAFAGNHWWVLLLPLAMTVALVPLAFELRRHRDLGAGLRQDRPGPARGELDGVWDLAVRLQDRVLAAWAVAVVVFGVVIGSLLSSINEFFTSSNAQDFIRKLGGAHVLTDAFLAAEIGLMGVLAAAYGLAAANHLRSEETAGHTEALLGTDTTRTRWATSHFAVALGGIALLMLLTGLSIGAGAALSLHDGSQVGRITLAALAQVPAAWVIASAVLAVFGWVPRLTGALWGCLALFVALGEFGDVWNAPRWLMSLSPFQHSPTLPVGTGGIGALAALVGIAVVLAAIGYLGWRRRDLMP
jgi:polyether ionophore transport system permease protein